MAGSSVCRRKMLANYGAFNCLTYKIVRQCFPSGRDFAIKCTISLSVTVIPDISSEVCAPAMNALSLRPASRTRRHQARCLFAASRSARPRRCRIAISPRAPVHLERSWLAPSPEAAAAIQARQKGFLTSRAISLQDSPTSCKSRSVHCANSRRCRTRSRQTCRVSLTCFRRPQP